MILFGVVLVALLVVDLASKALVSANFELGESFRIIPGLFRGIYARNDGMAFGWMSGGRVLFVTISTLLIIGAILFYLRQKGVIKFEKLEVKMGLDDECITKRRHIRFSKPNPSTQRTRVMDVAFALFIAGAIGNLVDRIIFGYVRDFVSFEFWSSFPIFNLADMFINIGVVMLLIYFIFLDRKEREINIRVKPKIAIEIEEVGNKTKIGAEIEEVTDVNPDNDF